VQQHAWARETRVVDAWALTDEVARGRGLAGVCGGRARECEALRLGCGALAASERTHVADNDQVDVVLLLAHLDVR
jgi:hypothetical protein